ncbi:MAG TPA: hypothetical protein VN668_09225 [Stellaceae bacterium]|nr:hypothetical protein [Stellaceae bacterium]
MASTGRIGRTPESVPPRRYVASLLWPAGLSRPANDNRVAWTMTSLFSLAASAALLGAAVWAIVT